MSGIEDAAAVPYGAIPRLGAIKDKKGMPDLQTRAGQKLDIIDIRHAAVDINLKPAVLSSFCARDGPRTLPTLLLYDERGLQLFEKARLARDRTSHTCMVCTALTRYRSHIWRSTT